LVAGAVVVAVVVVETAGLATAFREKHCWLLAVSRR
jgi:hypothetical protein